MSVRVKICGITTPDQARHAQDAGADYLGVLLAPSKRRVDADAARAIRAAAPDVRLVGVFVNESTEAIARLVREIGLDAAQLHGDETPAAADAIRRELGNEFEIIKAVPVREPLSPGDATLAPWEAVLLDSPGGGTGLAFDWSLVDALALCPHPRVFLAGGLTPRNVADAVARLAPWAVDVSSGVESAPGIKDPELVEQFIRNAKDTR